MSADGGFRSALAARMPTKITAPVVDSATPLKSVKDRTTPTVGFSDKVDGEERGPFAQEAEKAESALEAHLKPHSVIGLDGNVPLALSTKASKPLSDLPSLDVAFDLKSIDRKNPKLWEAEELVKANAEIAAVLKAQVKPLIYGEAILTSMPLHTVEEKRAAYDKFVAYTKLYDSVYGSNIKVS